MTAPCRLRPAGAVDAAVLAALHAACFPQEPWDARAMAELLAMPGTYGRLAWCAAAGADPVAQGLALARLAGGEAEVLTLGVVPAARRRGTGTRLLAAVAETGAAAGAGRLVLEAAADNAPAIALYRRAGFAEIGRRPAYYPRAGGAAVDAVVLARRSRARPACVY